jgi:hypothetical protein
MPGPTSQAAAVFPPHMMRVANMFDDVRPQVEVTGVLIITVVGPEEHLATRLLKGSKI